MKPWNEETTIANNDVRIVKFYFETSKGPGHVTSMVNKGISISDAKSHLLVVFEGCYDSIEIVKYEIIEIISDSNNPTNNDTKD